MLRMLDSPSQILPGRVRLERALADIERLAVGAIADCVHAELEIVPHCQAGGLLDFRDGRGVETGAPRFIGVRREKPCAARTESPIHVGLDRAYGQMSIAVVDHSVPGELRPHALVRLPDHYPQPHPHLSFIDHLLHQIDRGKGRSRILEGRNPFRERLLRGKLQNLSIARHGFSRRRGRLAGAVLDQALSRLAQQSRGVA